VGEGTGLSSLKLILASVPMDYLVEATRMWPQSKLNPLPWPVVLSPR